MAYYFFIYAAGGVPTTERMYANARRQLSAGYWGIRQGTAYTRLLKRGDQALIYVGQPYSQFIGRGVLASGVRPWPARKQERFHGFDHGVSFSDYVLWDSPVHRTDPSEPFVIRGPHGVHELTRERFFEIARLGEEARAATTPWGPGALVGRSVMAPEWSYVVVEEVSDDGVRLAVSPWPMVDSDGNLHTLPELERLVSVEAALFETSLDATTSESDPIAGVARVFAVHATVDELTAYPATIVEANRVDVTLAAHDVLTAAVHTVERASHGAAVEPAEDIVDDFADS